MNRKPEYHAVIATPAYNSQTTVDYTQSILNNAMYSMQHDVLITTVMLGNESLITRARNTLAAIFLQHAEDMEQQTGVKPTHLIFIDADMGFPANMIHSFVTSGVECVGAPVRLKGMTQDGKPVYNVSPFASESEEKEALQNYVASIKFNRNLKPVHKIGTALFCLDYATVQLLADNSPAYNGNSLRRGASVALTQTHDIFQSKVVDGELLSEDYFVCDKLWKLGIPVFCDYNIENTHTGMMQLHTNPQYDKFL